LGAKVMKKELNYLASKRWEKFGHQDLRSTHYKLGSILPTNILIPEKFSEKSYKILNKPFFKKGQKNYLADVLAGLLIRSLEMFCWTVLYKHNQKYWLVILEI
jgi:hypothetical protein